MKNSLRIFGPSILFILFCVLIFNLFQDPSVYYKSLAKVSSNYYAIDASNYNIIQLDTPFVSADETKFNRWDSWFYSSIKNNSYAEDNSGTEGRFAFFPLFPFIWKISNLKINQIGYLNLIILIISLFIGIKIFYNATSHIRENWISNLLIILPTSINYFLPYSESIFLLTFILCSYYLIKSNKLGFFIFLTLFSTTRPAITFVLISILIVQFFVFIYSTKKIKTILNTLFLIAPLILGTTIVVLIQYQYSSDFFKFIKVQTIWNHVFRIPNELSDWSIESFGNSIAVLFLISLPAFLLFLYEILSKNSKIKKYSKEYSSIFEDKDYAKEFLYIISILYIIGITLFILFWQGGSLNGLCRYILCSPFFLIFISNLIFNKINEVNKYYVLIVTFILFLLSFYTITHVKYSPQLEFRDLGFALTSIILLLLYNINLYNKFRKPALAIYFILLLISSVWLTYMFNIFLSEGWLFT